MDFLEKLRLDERKLIVGIDFGTTFSGAAWAETRRLGVRHLRQAVQLLMLSQSDHHSVIEIWPSRLGTREGMSSVKVPTELRYTPEGIEWGFQIPPIIERHQWFKLGLDDNKTSVAGAGQQKTSEELTTDYLTELYKHLMYTIEQQVGGVILRTVPLEFYLTVPAIWSPTATEKTLEAFRKASQESKSEIHMVSEPEAAAIYALHGLDPHGLNIGDSFVLCDAGGGTVDLISYTITELHPILKVKEAAPGTGGLCGSTFLNRRFSKFLTEKLGGEAGWDDEILAEAMERFDTVIKRQYAPITAGEDGHTILVPGLADNPRLGIRRGRFTIQPAEMKGIFDPIIWKIIELVRGQIKSSKRTISAVLLVGGFGQNNYLKEYLRRSLDGTKVLQPPNAWTAIVRGAIVVGMSRANSTSVAVGVVSRAARKHYGVELSSEYDEDVHDASKRYWNDKYKRYRIRVMHWFIRKGDAVQENKPHAIDFHNDHLVSNGAPKSFTMAVYVDSDSPKAPLYKGESVRKLVNLVADFKHVSPADLTSTITTRKDGQRYYTIRVAVEATFYSASTKYVLLCQGKRYDTVTAEYV